MIITPCVHGSRVQSDPTGSRVLNLSIASSHSHILKVAQASILPSAIGSQHGFHPLGVKFPWDFGILDHSLEEGPS